jgi:hypothetical protein
MSSAQREVIDRWASIRSVRDAPHQSVITSRRGMKNLSAFLEHAQLDCRVVVGRQRHVPFGGGDVNANDMACLVGCWIICLMMCAIGGTWNNVSSLGRAFLPTHDD